MTPDYVLTLVQITGPDFTAGIEIDGATVRKADPVLQDMMGMPVDTAREHIRATGWKASLSTSSAEGIVQHEESFEVLKDGKRGYFYFDCVAGRRAINGRSTKAAALQRAQAYLASRGRPAE
ncbi:hypothetical protein BRDID11004_60450 [Bradyrhizobium diazoefficiens]|uniref:Uncharacterized protein n=1 Tax=Bradyrhizobium diazoefficiens TaxID=1355477 RepID=A0A810AEW2_9BRAD|nr:hypothetical protein [Bradyrhizobium diazoefficiens]BBZ93057.1 hypothetical protein F07S3_28900 [Bradyrhizobium diazoefficiens]BCA10807.1 hypothetical protein BDHF08_26540 [Bradyrhizobium diazoefficiens]BCE55143.1 hypothetical protein XF5B_26550 [Bradyrhizobium diazoefficiens]BCE63876.1 hypothetical protein XF6B_26750 [Bradyrhizobium diazoefficiens]